MAGMPRPRPPHLHHEATRHGKLVWYVRVGHGPRIRLKEEYGTPEFTAAYHAAVSSSPIEASPRKPAAETLAWLVERYRDSAKWAGLSMATRRQRENIFKHVLAKSGAVPFVQVNRKSIEAGKDTRKATPAQANNFIKAMRGLFEWAVKAELAKVDPTVGVEWMAHETEGFHTWTEAEVVKFEAHWKIGTRERLAFDLLLYTGLRRGDVVRLGRPHLGSDGVFAIRTEKTGEEIVAPLLPVLAETIAKSPTGELTFIAGERGGPMTKESFGNWFRETCAKAGVPGSAHGLRKAGATRAANNGATERELEAIFGWRGGKMAAHYTKAADRRQLARGAMSKLVAGQPNAASIPAPRIQAPAPQKKRG